MRAFASEAVISVSLTSTYAPLAISENIRRASPAFTIGHIALEVSARDERALRLGAPDPRLLPPAHAETPAEPRPSGCPSTFQTIFGTESYTTPTFSPFRRSATRVAISSYIIDRPGTACSRVPPFRQNPRCRSFHSPALFATGGNHTDSPAAVEKNRFEPPAVLVDRAAINTVNFQEDPPPARNYAPSEWRFSPRHVINFAVCTKGYWLHHAVARFMPGRARPTLVPRLPLGVPKLAGSWRRIQAAAH